MRNLNTLDLNLLKALDALLDYHYPMQVMRPPMGKTNQKVEESVAAVGYLAVVKWDVSETDPVKALAAVQIADDAFFTPTHYPDGPHWGYIETRRSSDLLAQTIRAAGLCSIAIYWQAFGQDVMNDYIDVYRRFLTEAEQQAHRRSIAVDTAPLLTLFIKEAQNLKTPRASHSFVSLFS